MERASELEDRLSAPFLLNLLNVSAYLVSVQDLERMLKDLMAQVVQTLPTVHAGMLWLYDRRAGKLSLASMHGLPLESATLMALHTCRINPGEDAVGQAFQANELRCFAGQQMSQHDPATFENERNRNLFHEINAQYTRPLIAACVPLRVGSEVLGVMQVFNLHPPDSTSQGEPEPPEKKDYLLPRVPLPPCCGQVLQSFANLIASTIRHAQLHADNQRYVQRLNAFDAVVKAVSGATDLQDLMESVLDVVLRLEPLSSGTLMLYDPSQALLSPGAYRAMPADYIETCTRLPVEGAPCEEVVLHAEPMIRPLMEDRGEMPLLMDGLQSCAYFPLLVGGTVVGVLGLYGDAMMPRTIDTSRLMTMSNQIGFAIANVRLYEDSQFERRKLNTVINSIAEGVVLCDGRGRLVLANEAAMDLLSLESLPFQQSLSEMVDFYGIRDLEGKPLPVEQLPMARALSGEVFHDYRVLLRGASGSNSVMSFTGAPTHSDDGKTIEGAVVIFRDITARQKLERAKDEFLAIAAHELRSPLTAVRGYSDMLLKREQQRTEADPRDVRGLTILSQQVGHMLRMVDNLLDVSRIDAGQMGLQIQQVNLVSLTSQVLDQNRHAAGNRQLVLESDETEVPVQCDAMRIRQVLTNLVGNAIKYSPSESTITIRLSSVVQEEEATMANEVGQQSHASASAVRARALVVVLDQGGWIPPEQREQLFHRYYRGRSRRIEGLGLGLYLCQQFVRMHGGHIWMESTEGKGNAFLFTLPLDRL